MKSTGGRRKYWLWILGALALAFALWNLLWYLLYFYPIKQCFHEDYRQTSWNTGFAVREVQGDNWFTCAVKAPDYLSTEGNLSLVSRDGSYDMLIWPNYLSGKAVYAVGVGEAVTVTEGQPIPKNVKHYTFYIDAAGKPVESNYEQIAAEYRPQIMELLDMAWSEWGVGLPPEARG